MNRITAALVRRSGHPWWQCSYSSGKVINEWDTLPAKLPVGDGRSSRWESVPKNGMVRLKLLCPDGTVGELETSENYKFFQLKVGRFEVGFNFSRRCCDAYMIGVITDTDGTCFCKAWESQNKKLIEFSDNIFNMRYRNIGRLSTDVQGLKLNYGH